MSAQTQANFQTVSLSRSVDYSETIDLVTQWRQGDVLRLHDSEEGPNSFANDWLLIKHSLSMPVVDDATGDRFLAQVLALRRFKPYLVSLDLAEDRQELAGMLHTHIAVLHTVIPLRR